MKNLHLIFSPAKVICSTFFLYLLVLLAVAQSVYAWTKHEITSTQTQSNLY